MILPSHPARGSDFGYTIFANAKGGVPRIAAADRFPTQGWSRLSRPTGFVKPPPLQLREKSQACYLTIGVKV